MSIASDAAVFFRSQRADRYIDTVTITDRDLGAWNRTTKQYDGGTPSTVYTGGALIRPASAGVTDRGMQGEVVYEYAVYIPFGESGIEANHVVTVDATLLESELVGAQLVVQAVEQDSYETHTKLMCNEFDGGGDRG